MIIKFVVDNHDFIRESNKALLLRIGVDQYVWIPCSLIEPYSLVQQAKIIIPDDMKFMIWEGDLQTIWMIEKKDKLTKCFYILANELKEKYYKWNNMMI